MRASQNENSLFCVKLHSVRYFVTSSSWKSVVSKVCRLHVQFFLAFGTFHNSFIFSFAFFIVISDDLNHFAQSIWLANRFSSFESINSTWTCECLTFEILSRNAAVWRELCAIFNHNNKFYASQTAKYLSSHCWMQISSLTSCWLSSVYKQNFHISQIVGRHRIFQQRLDIQRESDYERRFIHRFYSIF